MSRKKRRTAKWAATWTAWEGNSSLRVHASACKKGLGISPGLFNSIFPFCAILAGMKNEAVLVTASAAPTKGSWRSPLTILVLAVLSSAVAWWMIAWPVMTFGRAEKHVDHFGLVYAHMIGGTIMLFLGAANLYIGTTDRHFKYHKLLGRTYLIGGTAGVAFVVAILLSPAHNESGTVTFSNSTVSLLTLSFAWLACAAMAYRAVRNHQYGQHRDWIIRSYVLAWSFVFCRIASRVPGVEELGGGNAFIWLSWVGPFILCEIALQWRDAGKVRKPA